MTAIGTVAVALAAVGIAIWSDRRTGKRLADERTLADGRLARQLKHSDDQLEKERAAADKRLSDEISAANERLRQERQAAQEQEQYAEAYAVQVTLMKSGIHGDGEDAAQRLIVAIVNHGVQTIT